MICELFQAFKQSNRTQFQLLINPKSQAILCIDNGQPKIHNSQFKIHN